MKGIILHGGHGTRLRPLTHTGPKQLLPIANKPMSEYCVESLKNAGITDIAIIIGGIGSEKVREYYGDGSNFGVNFTFIEQDICNPIELDIDFDEIYNLACPASPIHYQKDPITTIRTSFLGAMNVLDLAKKCDAKILHTSTSEVYGDPLVHPQREDYWGHVNPIGIRSCYDEGKRAAETLMFDFNRVFDMNIKVVRIFNTYGPKMNPNDGRVVSNFIVQALKDQDITMFGDGKQSRSFCYVDDLIDGMIRLMNSRDGFTGPVNIGNPIEFTMLELAEKIIQITGSSSKIIFEPLPQDDPLQRQPVIDLAKKELDWQPHNQLEEGLRKTIAYFKDVI